MRFPRRLSLSLAALGLSLAAHAQAPTTSTAPRPTFSMGASLGTGVSFAPLEVAFPVSERAEVAAGLSLGGLMRRRRLSTELETRTLTKLRYTSVGEASVGARAYTLPDRLGGFLGGGLTARPYVIRATTTVPTLLGVIGDILLAPLTILGADGIDDISNSTSGIHAGGYLEGGYAYATRRGRRHAFGFRFDAAPVARTEYVLTDGFATVGPAGRRVDTEVTRALGEDFASAGLGLRAFFRFEL